jgi:hypothetical protein
VASSSTGGEHQPLRGARQRVSEPRSIKDAIWPAHEKLSIRRDEKT